MPNIKFRVSRPDGTAYDIVNDPAFTQSSSNLNLNVAWDTRDIYNAKPDGTTPGLLSGTSAEGRGYTLRMRIATIRAAAATAGQAADGSYTIPYFTALPVDATDLMVVMDGHPRALPPGETDWANSVNAWARNDQYYTGDSRVRLASEAACSKCHEIVNAHGGNRNGDPQGCLVCHNSSGAYGDDADISGTIAMSAMIHNLHAGKMPAFDDLRYPQSLARCEACHGPGAGYAPYNVVREDALPISTGPGADEFNVFDDTWSSATAGTCGTCHDSGPAWAHMAQNGGGRSLSRLRSISSMIDRQRIQKQFAIWTADDFRPSVLASSVRSSLLIYKLEIIFVISFAALVFSESCQAIFVNKSIFVG